MEPKKAFKSFRYKNTLVWKSARRGMVSALGKPSLEVGSPPEFRGEPGIWTPEDLLVGALNSCLMLTFLALSQSKGLGPLGYVREAEGLLENVDGRYRIQEITDQPRVAVGSHTNLEVSQKIMVAVGRNRFIIS